MERFDPEQYLALVARYRVTHSQLVQTMFSRMLKLPAAVRARYDLPSLEFTVHAAAPCPVQVKQQMIEWWAPSLTSARQVPALCRAEQGADVDRRRDFLQAERGHADADRAGPEHCAFGHAADET